MFFKKAGSRIFGVQLNKAEQKVLDAEIMKQILERDRQFEMDKDSSMLLMLHDEFGFGPKRLYRAWKMLFESNKKLREHYEMGPEDGGWLCRQRLKELGVDLERWYKDEGLGEG